MKKGKIWKNIIFVLVTLCLIVVILLKLTDVFQRKGADEKYGDFYEQEEDFDVLFLGTSHVINDVFPMELWNDYGIVSYNLGGHGNKIPTTYWVLKSALEETKPKLVVIDCLKIAQDYYASYLFSQVHLSIDAMPLSKTKIDAVNELVNEEETKEYAVEHPDVEQRSKIGLIWDFSVYHARWEELNKNDFDTIALPEKGAESRIAVSFPRTVDQVGEDERIDYSSKGVEYLRKMIEECQANDVEVLLIYLPFPASMTEQKEAYSVSEIAEEYGVNYIDFYHMDLVNYYTDMYDSDSHLNPSGARKVTNYLGSYITNHYDLPDRRNDENYAFWYDDYEEYEEYKITGLKSQNDPVNYLMMLADDAYDVVLEINNENILDDVMYRRLIANLGFDLTKAGDDARFFYEKGWGDEVAYVSEPSSMNNISTDIGKVYISQMRNSDIHILVMDHETGEEIDEVEFNLLDGEFLQFVANRDFSGE